jgi:hypothetical protein
LKRKHLLVFVPWLAVTFLLTLPLFVNPGWTTRFAWNAYLPVAMLSAIGVGYFYKKEAIFLGIILILGLQVIAGFVQAGQDIHPIIYEKEWEWFLQLRERHPERVISGAGGGLSQWLGAAGIPLVNDMEEGTHIIACDQSQKTGDRWLDGGCEMAYTYDESMAGRVEEKGGRFYLIRSRNNLPEDEFLNSGWDNNYGSDDYTVPD